LNLAVFNHHHTIRTDETASRSHLHIILKNQEIMLLAVITKRSVKLPKAGIAMSVESMISPIRSCALNKLPAKPENSCVSIRLKSFLAWLILASLMTNQLDFDWYILKPPDFAK
jgi:hypothetical protein